MRYMFRPPDCIPELIADENNIVVLHVEPASRETPGVVLARTVRVIRQRKIGVIDQGRLHAVQFQDLLFTYLGLVAVRQRCLQLKCIPPVADPIFDVEIADDGDRNQFPFSCCDVCQFGRPVRLDPVLAVWGVFQPVQDLWALLNSFQTTTITTVCTAFVRLWRITLILGSVEFLPDNDNHDCLYCLR
jgi:hypothetical protein